MRLEGHHTSCRQSIIKPIYNIFTETIRQIIIAAGNAGLWPLQVIFDTHSDILLGSAYVAVYAFSNSLYDSGTTTLIIISWGLGCALNVSITVAIVARLWWTSRTIASLTATPTRNRFASTTYAIIESSVIATVGGVLVLAFFASRSPFALTAFDVLAQMVVGVFLSHLLLRALSRSALAGITSTLNRRTGCDNWSIWLLEYWFLEDNTRSEG